MSSSDEITFNHLTTRLLSPTHPILLRPVQPADGPALAALLSDHRNTLYESPTPPEPMSEATGTAVAARMQASASAPTVVSSSSGVVLRGPDRVNLALLLLPGEEVIGLGGFGSIKDLPQEGTEAPLRVGDVGAMLTTARRGRGFAAEAVRLACEWGFRRAEEGGLQLDRITAGTHPENEAMVGLLEKKMDWTGKRGMRQERPGVEEIAFEVTRETWRK